MSDKQTSSMDQIAAANPQLAQNPLLNLVLTLVLGGSAVGGFFVNNSQWAEVSTDLKALRQEMNQISIRLAQFDSKVESIARLEAANVVLNQHVQENNTRLMKLELEFENLKKSRGQ